MRNPPPANRISAGKISSMLFVDIDRSALAKRIKRAREAHNMSQSDVAALCAVTRAATSQWELGNMMPNRRNLERLARRWDVPLDWLVIGEGDPVLPKKKKSLRPLRYAPDGWPKRQDQSPFDGGVPQPEIPEMADKAGQAGLYTPDIRVRHWWRIPNEVARDDWGANAATLLTFHLGTDSMEPIIKEGSHVFIDHSQTDVISGEIYAVNNEISVVIKRLLLDPDQKNMIGLAGGTDKNIVWVQRKKVTVIGRCVCFTTVRPKPTEADTRPAKK